MIRSLFEQSGFFYTHILLLQMVFEGACSPDNFTPKCEVKLYASLLGKGLLVSSFCHCTFPIPIACTHALPLHMLCFYFFAFVPPTHP